MADTLHPTPFLRFALLGDAAASGATGLLLAAGAGVLASLLGLPEGLLRVAGLALLPYAAFVAWIGARKGGAPRNAVRAVVVINLLWALDSVLLLLFGPVSPNGLGVAFVLAQAVVVLGFAAMQWTALRGAAAAPSARAVA
jgi:hypothetical protein